MPKIKPSDLWSLDDTLTKFILPRLIAFKKMKRSGYPVYKGGYQSKVSSQKGWEEILDKMILAFKLMDEDQSIMVTALKDQKKIEEGLKLFSKYYQGLWD